MSSGLLRFAVRNVFLKILGAVYNHLFYFDV